MGGYYYLVTEGNGGDNVFRLNEDYIIPASLLSSHPNLSRILSERPYEIVVNGGKHNLNYAPIPSDTKESQLTALEVERLNEIVKISLTGLCEALEFIDNENLEDYVDRISAMDLVEVILNYCN